MTAEITVFRSADFFSAGFPFALRHVVNDGREFHAGRRFRREFWKLSYIIDGCGDFLIDELRYPIRSGHLLLVHPGAVTGYDIKSGRMELYNILFAREFIAAELRELRDDRNFFSIFSDTFHQRDKVPLYVASDVAAEPLLRSMEDEYLRRRPHRRFMLRLQLLELLVGLARAEVAGRDRTAPEDLAGRVRYRIETGWNEALTLSGLATEFGVSAGHLARCYRASGGGTVMRDLKQRRLDHAAQRLLETDDPVELIGFESGFRDVSYFHRAFLARFGCSPGRWRRERRRHNGSGTGSGTNLTE